jgi:hypothetical protein
LPHCINKDSIATSSGSGHERRFHDVRDRSVDT